jgi:hypothetical protein
LYLNGNIYTKDLSENVVFKGNDKKIIDIGQNFDEGEENSNNIRIA